MASMKHVLTAVLGFLRRVVIVCNLVHVDAEVIERVCCYMYNIVFLMIT